MLKTLKKGLAALMVVIMMLTSIPLQGFADFEMSQWLSLEAEAVDTGTVVSEEVSLEADEGKSTNAEEGKSFLDRIALSDISYNNIAKEYLDILKESNINDSHTTDRGPMLFSVAPFSDEEEPTEENTAEEQPTSGTINETITWEFDSDTKTMTISGEGDIPAYYPKAYYEGEDIDESEMNLAPWESFMFDIEKLVIGEGITSIGDMNFYVAVNLKEIIFNEGLKTIGSGCFASAFDIRSLNLPSTLESIGMLSFAACMSLEKLYLNEGLKSIGEMSFEMLFSLKKAYFPSTLEACDIEEFAFLGAPDITINCTLPINLAPERLFSSEGLEYCIWLMKLEYRLGLGAILPLEELEKLTEEELILIITNDFNKHFGTEYSFEEIDAIMTPIAENFDTQYCADKNLVVKLCENAETHDVCRDKFIRHTIGDSEEECNCFVFSGDINDNISWSVDKKSRTLTLSGSGEFPADMNRPGLYSYANDYIDNLVFDIESTITDIGPYSFRHMDIINVKVPGTVTIIKQYSFADCRKLSSFEFVEELSSCAFWSRVFDGCSNLKELVLPERFYWIGDQALINSGIEKLVIKERNCHFDELDAIDTIPENTVIYGYADSTAEAYAKTNGRKFKSIDEFNIEDLKYEITNVSGYTESVAVITGYNGKAREIIVPGNFEGKSVVGIKANAFSDNAYIETVTLPESVSFIGQSAFKNCTALESINIPSNVRSIDSDAFSGCTGVNKVYASDLSSWLSISFANEGSNPLHSGSELYFGESPVTDITVPATSKTLGKYAFAGCTSLENVVISDGVETIGVGAFKNCQKLVAVVNNSNLKTLSAEAFYSCGELKSFCSYGSIKTIGTNVFGLIGVDLILSGYLTSDIEKYAKANDIKFEAIPDEVLPEIAQFKIVPEVVRSTYFDISAEVSDNISIADIKIDYSLSDDYINIVTKEYTDACKTVKIKERFDVSDIESGTYTVRITVTDVYGNQSILAKECSVDTTAPAVPESIDVEIISGGIHLEWADSVRDSDFSHYVIYRYSDGAGKEKLTTSKVTAYNDYKFEYDVEYNYQITSVDNLGNESEPIVSSSITMVKKDLIPTQFEITSPTNGSEGIEHNIEIEWGESTKSDYYNVFIWEEGSTQPQKPAYSKIKQTSISVELKKGTSYRACVQAVNGFGDFVTSEVTFTTTKGPDIYVKEVNTDTETFAGSSISVSWTVENQGERDTEFAQWKDYIYISPSETFDSNSILLSKALTNVSYLKVGEKYENSTTLDIPSGISGTYYVFVVTGKNGDLDDFTSDNNILRSQAINIILPPSPDLTITSLETATLYGFTPGAYSTETEIISDNSLSVKWTVDNTGIEIKGKRSWSDAIFLCSEDNSVVKLLDVVDVSYEAIYVEEGDNTAEQEKPDEDKVVHKNGKYTYVQRVHIPEDIYGDWKIRVCVDYYDELYENLNGNNDAEAFLDVTLDPPADLVVDEVVVPNNITSGKYFDMSWVDRNIGVKSVIGRKWTDKIYVSQSPVFDKKTAILLKTVDFVSENIENKDSIRLPVSYKGEYYLHFEVDSSHKVFEFETYDNNVNTVKINVIQGDLSDLVVNNVFVSGLAVAGEKIEVKYTVSNNGQANTSTSFWKDEIYLVDSSDKEVKLDTVKNDKVIKSSDEIEVVKNVVVPSKTTEGEYRIRVKVNSDEAVVESYNNNNISESTAFTVRLHRDIDLEVKLMSINATAFNSSEPIELTYTVKNNGEHTAESWEDAIILSTSEDSLENTVVVKKESIGKLDPGKEYTRTVEFFLPSSIPNGKYYIYACANHNQNLWEADYENNFISSFELGEDYCYIRDTSDLSVTAVDVPESVKSGEEISISYVVKNNSQHKTYATSWKDKVYLAETGETDLTKAYLLSVETIRDSLVAGESYQKYMKVRIPDGISGEYTICVVNDAENSNKEVNTENNTNNSVAFNVELSPYPDVIVEITEIPDEIIAAQPFEIEYRITNNGSAPTKDKWSVAIEYVLGDADPIKLATVSHTEKIGVGDYETFKKTVTIPAKLGGEGKIIVTANSKSEDMYETSFDNNKAEISVNVLPLPINELTVCNVVAPVAATPGEDVTVTWDVVNLSTSELKAWVVDNVYISADDKWDINDVLVTQHERKLVMDASESDYTSVDFKMLSEEELSKITEEASDELPGVVTGEYYIIVRTDVKNQINEPDENNNSAASGKMNVTVKNLSLNKTVSGSLQPYGEKYYKLSTQAGKVLYISLDTITKDADVEVFVSANKAPTATEHDYQYSALSENSSGITIPATQSGDYYICVRNADSSDASFKINATELDYGVKYIYPTEGGKGKTTIKLVGALFSADMQAYLYDGNKSFKAEKIYYMDSSNVYATFDLSKASNGSYDLKIVSSQGEAVSKNIYNVRNLQKGELVLDVNVASAIRIGNICVGTFTYRNVGYTDVYAPTVYVKGDNAKFKPADSEEFLTEDLVFCENQDGLAGILAHGEGGTYTFTYQGASLGRYSINIHNVELKDSPIVLNESSSYKDILKYNLQKLTGTTGKEYTDSLALMASYLDQFGGENFEVEELESAYYMNAFASYIPSVIGEQTDIVSRDIYLSREFSNSLINKYDTGIFGKGWKSDYEITVEYENNEESEYIAVNSGNYTSVYRPDESGDFVSVYGGSSKVTLDELGNITLNDADGTVYTFGDDGLCDEITDTNGNKTVLTYTDGKLTAVTDDINGEISLEYTDGKVTKATTATDTVIYTYNGDYLASVTTAYGTTAYEYDTASIDARKGSLVKAVHPDGVAQYFEYDDLGRITSSYCDGGVEKLTYAYSDTNELTVYDSVGNSEKYCFDGECYVARYTDMLGSTQHIAYNENGLTESVSYGFGNRISYEYDEGNNLSAVISADGHKTAYTNDDYGNITSITDKRGILTTYEHDSKGNNTSIIYEDSSKELYIYDSKGNVLTYTDRKGNVTEYEYNSYSDITKVTYADGSYISYEYDERGNMTKVDDNGEITLLTYNERGDLIKILYPDGKSVNYTYDDLGRTVSVTDGDGEGSYYAYDEYGRVKTLSSKNKLETTYYYNSDSSMQKSVNSNGTFTVYEYENGVVKSIYNYGADSKPMSYFIYEHDSMGNITSMETKEGTWNHEYDINGQLIKSVSPVNEVTEYTYDLSGNRISVTVNGEKTEYTANRLNQYTKVGSDTFTYDKNGNMISMTDEEGNATVYEYDNDNRLVSVTGNGSTYKYTYDIFGLRNSVEKDGEKTVYLNSPDGAGDAIASYDSEGKTNYLHGTKQYMYNVNPLNEVTVDTANGLTAALKNGESYYYSYNHLGSTIDITDKTGIAVNSYTYNQEGAVTSRIETITNPYTYVGEYGIADDNNGLYYMRARYVSQTTDAFTNPDPPKQKYDQNIYRYAGNNTVKYIDINGEMMADVKSVCYGEYCYDSLRDKRKQERIGGGIFGLALLTGIGALAGGAIGGALGNVPGATIGAAKGAKIGAGIGFGLGLGGVVWADEPEASDGGDCVAPKDPNDILGPEGYGDAKWIGTDETLAYTIRFENDPEFATAPVQKLVVTQTLDENIDLRSFRLTGFGFGEHVFTVPDNTSLYQTRIDMLEEHGIYVDVFAGVDVVKKSVTYTFTAIDPATGTQPADPFVGFLPVNDENHIGEGFIQYTAKLKNGVETGTVVSAEASIIFDNNEAIDTPVIFNTVDADAPVAALKEVAMDENGKARLIWESSDGDVQSGVNSVDIYVSENNSEFVKVKSGVIADSEYLQLEADKLYGFIVRATDNAGNTEPMETEAELNLDTGYKAVKPEKPVIKELSHNADGALVALEAAEGCTIFYTLDGTEPTALSDKYNEAVFVANDTVIRAVAISKENTVSDIAEHRVEKLEAAVVSVTGVTLDKTAITLTEGEISELVATVAPENAINKNVKWTSDNESVLTVDANGKITAVKMGKAKVTVTTNDGGFTVVCEVEVLCSHNNAENRAETAPTCTENGYKAGKYCDDCEKWISGHESIPATGHAYTNACDKDCNVCKATRTPAAHKGGTATCTAKAKCSVCGASYGSLKAHTYKNVTTKATLTKNGKVESKCSDCGLVKSTTTVYYPKTIKLSKTAYTYNGKVQTPSVTVKDSKGNTLKKDTDYTVKYESGRKSPGKYTVTITFKGKYTGTKKLTYTIAPEKVTKLSATQTTTTITLKWSKVTGADGYRVYKYNSKTKKYEKLKDVTKNTLKIEKLKAGTAYKYKVKAYTKDDGTIWGDSSKVFETATKCKTPSITKLTTTKGKASFTWSNVSGESSYQVYYSTKKDSGYKKVKSYKVNTTKGSKSKLKSGKKYYFKVRAYKKTASGTVYSSWSAVKSVKVK